MGPLNSTDSSLFSPDSQKRTLDAFSLKSLIYLPDKKLFEPLASEEPVEMFACKVDLNNLDPAQWCDSVEGPPQSRFKDKLIRIHNQTFAYLLNKTTMIQDFYIKKLGFIEFLAIETRDHILEWAKWQRMCMAPEIYKIPPVINKFWLTHSSMPRDIPQEFLQNILSECEKLGSHWEFVIWITKSKYHEESLKILKEHSECKVTERSIFDEPRFQPALENIENFEFSRAITRMKPFLNEIQPGFYEDMDASIVSNIDYFLQFKSVRIYHVWSEFILDYFESTASLAPRFWNYYNKDTQEFEKDPEDILLIKKMVGIVHHNKASLSSWIHSENKGKYF